MVRLVNNISLFSYGTLQYAEIVHKVVGTRFPFEKAVLENYARYLVRGAVYPAIIEEPHARVEGVLYHGLNASHIQRLDRYEGPGYLRIESTVVTVKGDCSQAMVYVFNNTRRNLSLIHI